MDISGALSAIGASLSIAKELKEIDASFDKAELKLKIAELTSALAEAKLGLVDVNEELHRKNDEIAELGRLLAHREASTAMRNNKRYFTNEAGEPKGPPICPVCERQGLLLQVVQDRSKGTAGAYYACPKCKANYGLHPGVLV